LGVYMLFDYARRRGSTNRVVRFESRRPPPSVVVSSANEPPRFKTGEKTQFVTDHDRIKPMAFIIKAFAGISALILLVVTLLGSILTLGGFLLAAIKVLIVVIFVAVLSLIGFSIL